MSGTRPGESTAAQSTPVGEFAPAELQLRALPQDDELAAAGVTRRDVGRYQLISDAPASAINSAETVLRGIEEPLARMLGPGKEDGHARDPIEVLLISDMQRFEGLGLAPPEALERNHGLQLGRRVWLRLPETEYYERHLLIHELVHAEMMRRSRFQGLGSLWLHEGLAEYVATHRVNAKGELELAVWPDDVKNFPGWPHFRDLGREEFVSLHDLLRSSPADFRSRATSYAYAWGLCHFLERHPAFQKQFRDLMASGDWEQVTRLNREILGRETVELEWLAFLAYAGEGEMGLPLLLDGAGKTEGLVELRPGAHQKWVPVFVSGENERVVGVRTSGEIFVSLAERRIMVQPPGVTVIYRDGFPLGATLGVIAPANPRLAEKNPFRSPVVLDRAQRLAIPPRSMLLVSINQPALEQRGDGGSYRVEAEEVP